MQINKALTNLIRGRSIHFVAEEKNRGTIVFNDGSTMQVKAVGQLVMKKLGDGQIDSVGEDGVRLAIYGEENHKPILDVYAHGASITVTNRHGAVEYTG
jgi:hypothetical protein